MSFDSLRRAYRGALSKGYGYEEHGRGQNARPGEIAGYFIDYRPKIPSREANPHETLYPADLAQLALGWWERLVLGEHGAGDAFLELCGELERTAEATDGTLLWPYRIHLPKYDLPVPWYSGMAQGQIASVFVRAWSHTREDRYGDLALRSVEPLLQPGRERLVTMTADGPVLEESGPCAPPSQILNGWVFALWGVRDVSVALTDVRAARLADDTTACLAQTLPRYDVGWWSKYSLYPHPLPDLAKPFYHRLHVTQLEILHETTGLAEFGRWADRWRSYDRRAAAIASVGSKIPFLVTNGLARRRTRADRSS